MTVLDDKIAETLDDADREILESCGTELGLFGLMAESFRGKSKATSIAIFLLILAFAVVLVYSAVHFFTIDAIGMKLNWMAIGLTALFVIVLLRLWYIIELNRLAVVRNIKRLELQIALLSRKL